MVKDIVIFDIDGTLANGEHRQKFVRAKPKNWPAYNERMADDTVHEHVRKIYWSMQDAGLEPYIVSGREDYFRDVTVAWLEKHAITGYKALYMRPAKDYRGDDIIKEEILKKYFPQPERILCVFDDRPRVIRMWRRNGIKVLDCGDGVEF